MVDLSKLKSHGVDCQVDDLALLINPEMIELGNHVRIDAFTKILGGKGVKIGDYCHISSFCSIIGGGEFIMGDYSTTACGCRIITGDDDYLGGGMTNPTVPRKFRPTVKIGKVKIGKHTILGTNTIVHINTKLGDGTATGSGTIVTKDLPEWGIWIGAPAKLYKKRRSDIILSMEEELRNGI
jgi:galactoside O-acetyltransferase